MSLVACLGIIAAFFVHDDVLEKHWADERGRMKVVEPDLIIGG